MTYQEILNRDVSAIVAASKELSRAGIVGNVAIYYRHEEIAGVNDVMANELGDDWKPSGVVIPCNVPWGNWYNFLYQRLGNVPLFAK